jgi:hypothetical protein
MGRQYRIGIRKSWERLQKLRGIQKGMIRERKSPLWAGLHRINLTDELILRGQEKIKR